MAKADTVAQERTVLEIRTDDLGTAPVLADFFGAVFTASEGAEEGKVIGDLVRRQLAETAPADIRVYTAWESEALIGAAVFTRLTYEADRRTVFILSPMAVATDRQGQGIGQDLLRGALADLRDRGVDIAVTYGDPAFYGKVGFAPLSEALAPPPVPLSFPEGWIGQSLTDAPMTPMKGPCRCVDALADPAIW